MEAYAHRPRCTLAQSWTRRKGRRSANGSKRAVRRHNSPRRFCLPSCPPHSTHSPHSPHFFPSRPLCMTNAHQTCHVVVVIVVASPLVLPSFSLCARCVSPLGCPPARRRHSRASCPPQVARMRKEDSASEERLIRASFAAPVPNGVACTRSAHVPLALRPHRRAAVPPATLKLTWDAVPSDGAACAEASAALAESLRLLCTEHGGQVDALVLVPRKGHRKRPGKFAALVSFRSVFGAVCPHIAAAAHPRPHRERSRPRRGCSAAARCTSSGSRRPPRPSRPCRRGVWGAARRTSAPSRKRRTMYLHNCSATDACGR